MKQLLIAINRHLFAKNNSDKGFCGVVGVTSAYYLARQGHGVTVVDRHQP